MTSKANLTALHKGSNHNRSSLAKSMICGCFYCFKEFSFNKIIEWMDDNETALCPYCGVDAVLGFGSPSADQELLHEMHERWFKPSLRPTRGEWKSAIEKDVWPSAATKASRK